MSFSPKRRYGRATFGQAVLTDASHDEPFLITKSAKSIFTTETQSSQRLAIFFSLRALSVSALKTVADPSCGGSAVNNSIFVFWSFEFVSDFGFRVSSWFWLLIPLASHRLCVFARGTPSRLRRSRARSSYEALERILAKSIRAAKRSRQSAGQVADFRFR